jgi:tetrahydromethanopterin S-methyltransferase subunit B
MKKKTNNRKRVHRKKSVKHNNPINPNNKSNKSKTIKNRTPRWLNILSKSELANGQTKMLHSYAPTVNQELITLQSNASRSEIGNCNDYKAFKLEESLKILVDNTKLFGKKCAPYSTVEAKRVLLANLAANKHIDPDKIIPPKQIQSNCWFNAMFVTFFVSDKGRKFFHFFRQLMIEGKQHNGKNIPNKLRDAFALLNFAIESALNGTKYAIELNTNSIIKEIYDAIPESYNKDYVSNVNESGNPIKYYKSIIGYLGDNSIIMLVIQINEQINNWSQKITNIVNQLSPSHLPHIIVIEIFDGPDETAGPSGKIKNKPLTFNVKEGEYSLDSAVVRDIEQQHFCAMVTCQGKEMAYDGYSFHRLTPSEWKGKINKQSKWQFEGTNNYDGTPLKWSFLHCYQMLMYYRVK